MRSHCTVRLVLTALALAIASPSFAQGVYEWQPAGADNWNVNANWMNGQGFVFIPDTDQVAGESAAISNGGTAVVNADVPRVAGINVSNGVVDIQGGGMLETATVGGAGTLAVGAAGAVNLSGTGQLNIVGSVNNAGTVQLTGPGATFTVANSFSSTGTLAAGITNATSHSVINVAGSASVGGTLNVDFSGVTPSFGDTWDLIDAASISGGIGTVNATGNVPSGMSFFFQTQAGGSNGMLGQVAADVQLVLSVNRRTGATSIENRVNGQNVNLDGYLIESGSNSLDPGAWTSLSTGDSNWTESNPGANSLGELNLTGSSTLAGGSNFDLGNVYDFTPTALGQVEPGLQFEYHTPDGGTRVGLVEFEGPRNNLVLIVDPATGEAAIQNQSIFNVEIDGYQVTSESSSLDPAGFAGLGGGWTVSNPAANHIGDLNLDGSLPLTGGTAPMSVGSLFDFDKVGAEQDLVFEFHLAGGDTMTGIVEYGMIPTPSALPGDYNADGVVNGIDYAVWRENLGLSDAALNGNGTGGGTVGTADFNLWKANYGATAGAGSVVSTPEPSSLLVLLSSVGILAIRRRRSVRSAN